MVLILAMDNVIRKGTESGLPRPVEFLETIQHFANREAVGLRSYACMTTLRAIRTQVGDNWGAEVRTVKGEPLLWMITPSIELSYTCRKYLDNLGITYAPVAQRIEQGVSTSSVAGSIPAGGTNAGGGV